MKYRTNWKAKLQNIPINVSFTYLQILNVNLGDIYKKEEAIIKRRPTKITDFLDRLKAAIIQKSKEEEYWQHCQIKS